MKPLKQLLMHDPANGIYGDCHRTCIAMILNLNPEDVEHFGRDGCDSETFRERVKEWLARYGLTEINIAYPGTTSIHDVLTTLCAMNPGTPFILGCTSRLGTNHSVVCPGTIKLGEIMWHDPSLVDSGVAGPMSDGYYWATYIVGDIDSMPQLWRKE